MLDRDPALVDAVEEIWHGLSAPYRPLFDWLLTGAPRPSSNAGGGTAKSG